MVDIKYEKREIELEVKRERRFRKREQASRSRRGTDYVELSDELGIESELPDLVETGQAEILTAPKEVSIEVLEEMVELEPFKQFYQETQRLNINPFSLYSDLETKRELIKILHLNLKSLGGRKSVDEIEDRYIGPAFRHLYEQALKKLN